VSVLRLKRLGIAATACMSVAVTAHAADLVTKAPTLQTPLPAVDGINGKADAFDGSLARHSFYGGTGSFSVPLGQQFGFQTDGLTASYRGDFLSGIGGHGFWRDPSKGLIGLYGDYLHWDRLGGAHVGHFGAEGAVYLNRVTLEGVVGVESGNNRSAVIGGLVETVNLTTRMFDKVDLAYYVTDDLQLFIGHRYFGGKSLLALGGEWQFANLGNASSVLFVEGRVGTERLDSVWAGVRFYFGQKPKSLIRRHREDDPPVGLKDSASAFGNAGKSTPAPAKAPPLTCPTDFHVQGNACVPNA
jgi:hypothetical protein